jgi:hypothetical protein
MYIFGKLCHFLQFAVCVMVLSHKSVILASAMQGRALQAGEFCVLTAADSRRCGEKPFNYNWIGLVRSSGIDLSERAT